MSQMWVSMAPTGKLVIAILGLVSIYSLAVVVERLAALRWSRRQTRAFVEEAAGIDDLQTLLTAAEVPERQQYCSLATVVASALREFHRLREEGHDGDILVESVEEGAGRGLQMTLVNLRTRLTDLATIAGVAPFLGLLGTVTGLIAAFRGIAETGGGGLAAVSSGVSEALVTTVVGLFVAMPALWAYNYLLNRVDVMGVELERAARGVLMARVLSQARPAGAYPPHSRRERPGAGGRKISALPDITPIVNVALVLLIIFMIVTPMIREGIQVDTPQAEAVTQLSESDQAVVLAIRDDGSLFVNLKPVQSAGLAGELALAYRGNEGRAVVIKGAQNLPYSEILALMDVCKSIGAPAVDLVAHKVR